MEETKTKKSNKKTVILTGVAITLISLFIGAATQKGDKVDDIYMFGFYVGLVVIIIGCFLKSQKKIDKEMQEFAKYAAANNNIEKNKEYKTLPKYIEYYGTIIDIRIDTDSYVEKDYDIWDGRSHYVPRETQTGVIIFQRDDGVRDNIKLEVNDTYDYVVGDRVKLTYKKGFFGKYKIDSIGG